MKGRPPKPTRLKILEGNPGHRRLDLAAEPQPARTMPRCPEFLDDAAKTEWFRVCEELHRLGLLTDLDRSALGAYCSAFSQWAWSEVEIRRLMQEQGGRGARRGARKTKRRGARKTKRRTAGKILADLNVARGLRKNALREMKQAGEVLGLSPASRTRIRVEPADDGQIPLPGMEEETAFQKTERLARGA